ncbi:retrovirus-related pol polyprotein from transposon TNT 1-94 [Tanacetum coccineum]
MESLRDGLLTPEQVIILVRSDNALEFLKGSLGPLMDSLGIEHQTSCVDRPRQNGRVFECLAVASNCSRVVDKFEARDWCKAINDELRALEENHTWDITTLPADKKVIACHEIYKTKLKDDGSLDRKNSRLVINGNRQRKGVD